MIYRIFGKFILVAMGFLTVPFGLGARTVAQGIEDSAGQLMLLKNGSVLQGFIERTANHYTIQTRPGNRLHLPFDKVEVIADSYAEIYWRRLATIGAADTAEQEALFHWCLRYRLWEEAANQLEILKAINSDNAFPQRLERQLKNALAERDRQQAAAAKAANHLPNHAASNHAASNHAASNHAASNHAASNHAASNHAASNHSDADLAAANHVQTHHAAANQAARLLTADQAINQAAPDHSTSQSSIAEEPTPRSQAPELAQNVGGVSPAGNESFFETFEPVFRPLPSAFDQPKLDSLASSRATAETVDRLANAQADSQVRQVGFEDVGGEESAADPLLNLSVRELEQFIQTLPKNSFAQFRSRIEPILISKCSDCHQKGGQTNEMPIMLRGKRMPVTIRMSQRNLVSAIKYVDAANLDASTLLTAAATAHGDQKSGSITEDSADYQAIKDWIGLVTNAANAEAQNTVPNSIRTEQDSLENSEQSPASGSAEPKKMLQPMSARNLPAGAGLPQAASSNSRVSTPRPIQILHSPNLRKLEPLPPTVGEIPSLSEPAERFIPRDDFDPEIFNRQFGKTGWGKGN